MRLDQGLFQLDFEDHHAVLGIPIGADTRAVRKRYLAIARRLHPDSLSATSAAETQQASQMLSKWVNPAYEALSQEKSATEHGLVLKLKGQALRQTKTPPSVTEAVAQDLLQAPHVEAAYRQAVNALAENQYARLETTRQVIGQISELNLIYLYRISDSPSGSSSSPEAEAQSDSTTTSSTSTSTSGPANATAPPPPRRRTQAAILESYINRAQEYERDRDYGQAILELREALKTYPNSALAHSYLAGLYLKAGQSTMARIHAKRALDIHPDDEKAKAIQTQVEKGEAAARSSGNAAKAANKSGGGFFGLFGGKKK